LIRLKGKKMENYVTCPNCNKTISNEPIIEAAARKDYSESRSINCDCGERITYWNITAQLRKQKTFGARIRAWLRPIPQEQT
jgi:DNA-directed RNA polymerase subunit RPC12/RpoP